MDIMQHQARKEGDAQRAKIRHLFPENNCIVPDPDLTQPWTDAESMAALWKAKHNITPLVLPLASRLALLSRRLTSRVFSPNTRIIYPTILRLSSYSHPLTNAQRLTTRAHPQTASPLSSCLILALVSSRLTPLVSSHPSRLVSSHPSRLVSLARLISSRLTVSSHPSPPPPAFQVISMQQLMMTKPKGGMVQGGGDEAEWEGEEGMIKFILLAVSYQTVPFVLTRPCT